MNFEKLKYDFIAPILQDYFESLSMEEQISQMIQNTSHLILGYNQHESTAQLIGLLVAFLMAYRKDDSAFKELKELTKTFDELHSKDIGILKKE